MFERLLRYAAVRRLPGFRVVALAVVALGAGAAGAATPVPPKHTLEKIRETGAITIAVRESSIPFSYVDASKRPIGFSVEVCQRIAEAIRNELKLPSLDVGYLTVSAADRIPAIVEGRADLECGNTTNNAARRKQVAFSVTHFFAGGRLLVPAASSVRQISDLRGKTIVVLRGSTHLAYLRGRIDAGLLDCRVAEARDTDEAFGMLGSGRADAFLHDDVVLYALRASAPDPNAYRMTGDFTSVEPLALMLRKDDPEFKRAVDKALARMMIEGQFEQIYHRWFQAPIPPRNANLDVPMNALLRDQVQFPSDKVGDDAGG